MYIYIYIYVYIYIYIYVYIYIYICIGRERENLPKYLAFELTNKEAISVLCCKAVGNG